MSSATKQATQAADTEVVTLADFATPPFTLRNLSIADLRDLEFRAQAAGDHGLSYRACRAQDQLVAYRTATEDCDVDILEDCIAELNRQQAVIDAAFARAEETVERLRADSFGERRAWRLVLAGGR